MSSVFDWQTFSEACAFLGNSLLRPMTQTSDAGLDPEFWAAFPDFGSDEVACAAASCLAFAEEAAVRADAGEDMVERVSVEYTRLFVGPPSPAAAPWETFYRSEGASAGFGEATFHMRALLRDAGLRVSNGNNQYEDHMGLELLYLSEMCRRRAAGEADAEDAVAGDAALADFLTAHPFSWIAALRAKVDEAAPGGYVANLLGVAEALLREFRTVAL